ncbi:hypothetical protein F1880_002795 [Penicillium rolfsii]|nr:hypothetical protein F1880_002795 [Penicillium rolfsii]
MNRTYDYLRPAEPAECLLRAEIFDPHARGHLSSDGSHNCEVAEYLEYANLAYQNPFDERVVGSRFNSDHFDEPNLSLSNDRNCSKEHNLTEESKIIFHAKELDPCDPFDHLGYDMIVGPRNTAFEKWLETMMPKALNVNKSGMFHQLPQPCEENSIAPYERAEPTDHPDIDTLPLNSATASPCQSVSDLSETKVGGHKQKLLWGENGLLGLKEDVPSGGICRKSGLIRTMTKKLKNQLTEIVDESNKGFKRKSSSAVSISAPGSSAASLITSLTSIVQARLYSELEVMICDTANNFILQQYYDGRVSQHSINKINAAWNAKNNHHVVEFRFDQATQRELILANRRSMEFTGDSSRFPIRLQTNLMNWKKIAHEMSIRTFCLPDSAIRKHLYDLRQIIDMMNPSLETLRAFQDLCTRAQGQMLDQVAAARRQSEARLKKGLHYGTTSFAMTGLFHTYGPSCLLVDEEIELSSLYALSTPPEIRSQFFYVSSLPIDDPLAPLPPPTSGQASEDERTPPKPFSARDNLALEKSWRELGKAREAEQNGQGGPSPETSTARSGIAVPGRGSASGVERRQKFAVSDDTNLSSTGSTSIEHPSFPDELHSQSANRQSSHPGASADARPESYAEKRLMISSLEDDVKTRSSSRSAGGVYWKRDRSASLNDSLSTKRRSSSPVDHDMEDVHDESASVRANRSRDASISGSPFIRAPVSQSHGSLGRSVDSLPPRDGSHEGQSELRVPVTPRSVPKPSGLRATVSLEGLSQEPTREEETGDESQVKIPVGASRLHLVELPNLKMKPIYWNPLHDVSNVIRATWFYKNTMMPVEIELANKLEEGYVYLRPWTQSWQEELNSCVENGADAEMKIVYALWPKGESLPASRPGTAQELNQGTSESAPNKSAEAFKFDPNQAAGGTANSAEVVKSYATSSAIYVDARNAQILRPSLLPSVARSRRPLGAIRKGRQIGIPVVRGFSRKLWDQLHPSKPNPVDVRQYIRRSQNQNTALAPGRSICYACKMEEMRPSPSDLVLVIHGIGQKLSERMESFHFTHAINAFRRQVNMELNNEPVWPHVRKDHGGIMVLPVNWRTTLSLEDPAPDTPDAQDPASNNFTLGDITPETLPAVRSLISDVMLDIPYYLSHHKPKMIKAVAKEANRIYRLWCKNNPGFQDNGRVHLIAHSLGSVMAVDILSHQPTNIDRFDFPNTPLHGDIFEFDTRNLFLCGSPVGFFLLLNKASLRPRKGREKPGSEGEDRLPGVAGEAGKYGCLAVDNLYNIMHTTDPIAYRVNAAIDSDLANSLKTASIPSSTSSFIQSFGSVFRWSSTSGFIPTTTPIRPAAITKLPSTVEMETHDFTREEIAEKRMLLLNDNGQIDYCLSGGGGPLNIQYLNMLSAHSSYWTLTDFVRFVVVEIARKQGRDGTLLPFRAEKKKEWKYSKG